MRLACLSNRWSWSRRQVKAKVVRVKAKVVRVKGELVGVACCNAPPDARNRKDASRSYKEAGRRERQGDRKPPHMRSTTAPTATITTAPRYTTPLVHEYRIY